MSLNVVDERGQGSAGKSLMYFVNDEPDWSTVSFLEMWFLVFRFHKHEKFYVWSFYKQMTLDSSRGFSLSFEFSC